jgi:hypothetical protein
MLRRVLSDALGMLRARPAAATANPLAEPITEPTASKTGKPSFPL